MGNASNQAAPRQCSLLEACELALRIMHRDGIQALRGEAWTDGELERIQAAVDNAGSSAA